MTNRLKESQTTRVHMASRLDRIIYVLHQAILEDKPFVFLKNFFFHYLTKENRVDTETLVVTVAELKQVKDILNGLLDSEPLNVA